MTARILTGSIAVALALSASISFAGPWSSGAAVGVGAASVGQAGSSDTRSGDKQAQADDLLRRARQAMSENDLATAESLITQADALGVQYGPFHFGDTPKKARRDLDRRKAAADNSPVRPSQIFNPLSLQKKTAPPTDPFAGRNGNSAPAVAGGSESVLHLPPVDQPSPVQPLKPGPSGPPFGRAMNMDPPSENEGLPAPLAGPAPPSAAAGPAASAAGNQSNQLLLNARRAVALGDVRRAASFVEQAKAIPVNRGPYDDTPENVEAIIRRYSDLMAAPANRKDTEGFRREYARLLMEQAEGLLRRSDFDEAERLAIQAARQQVAYGPLEAKPENLLQRIAAARRQGTPPAAALSSPSRAPGPEGAGAPGAASPPATKQTAMQLVRLAREVLAKGNFAQAERLALQAEQLRVPETAYAPGEDRPGLVLADVRSARSGSPSGVVQAGGQWVGPAGGGALTDQRATRALYDPSRDPTRNIPAADQQPAPAPRLQQFPPAQQSPPPAAMQGAPPAPGAANSGANIGMSLFEQGEAALRARDTQTALQCFRQAFAYRDQLDPTIAQRLQDHLQLMSVAGSAGPQRPSAPSLADEAAAKQQVLIRQVQAEVMQEESAAKALCATNPKKALALLEQTRQKVEAAGLEPAAREQLLRRVDRTLTEMRQFVEENRPRIELDEKNQRIREEVDRSQHMKLEGQEKLALLVNDFNRLMDEQRYAEAEVLAKRAAELDPENPVVQQILYQSKFVHRFFNNVGVASAKEQGFIDALASVDKSSVPFDDQNPYVFGDVKEWEKLTKSRSRLLAERRRHRSERDLEIEQKLKTPVSLQFDNAPLSRVVEYLGKLAEVNVHLDPQGLADEGVTTDTPVTIRLEHEISLKSALNLILRPLHLNYVIKDEVLKITSEQLRDGDVYTVTYNVADLVVPIPNFVASPRMGLAGSYHDALGNVGLGVSTPLGTSTTPLAVVASKDGAQSSAAINPAILAQMSHSSSGATAGTHPSGMPMGFGPGGLGGGAMADFDSLIDLITSTVRPTTWDQVGGPGSIASFETNLSLVVSQTQDVHEEIADLLEQLRKMQDLQVTIEVRFITLNDSFFERIGVDFDFDINSNVDRPFQIFGRQDPTRSTTYTTTPFNANAGGPRDVSDQDLRGSQSVTVGLDAPGVFSADMDIPFRQNSYQASIPVAQFGNFDPTVGASLGFAILSEIEAYFFIQAAQGDNRTNVLQAPKVTLFNGQQAFVSDTSQSPFVISVIPVVGDFAAAQQPVIVVLSEGTFLTVQAVVSNDRRFVRLTLVPFFSKIGDVRTFTFTGRQTTTDNTSSEGVQNTPNDNSKKKQDKTTTSEGTTVQLPTFSFVTVTTTVSVPDGGTVLMGGIKRLNEQRKEAGVPMLNKIPYINRLFKNVGIGRETQSLMMMVTPRIIIQEEEEDRLGIQR